MKGPRIKPTFKTPKSIDKSIKNIDKAKGMTKKINENLPDTYNEKAETYAVDNSTSMALYTGRKVVKGSAKAIKSTKNTVKNIKDKKSLEHETIADNNITQNTEFYDNDYTAQSDRYETKRNPKIKHEVLKQKSKQEYHSSNNVSSNKNGNPSNKQEIISKQKDYARNKHLDKHKKRSIQSREIKANESIKANGKTKDIANKNVNKTLDRKGRPIKSKGNLGKKLNPKTKGKFKVISQSKKATKTVKQTKRTVKATKQTIKVTKQTVKATAKTAQQLAIRAKQVAKATYVAVKGAIKATVSAIKAIVLALKSLVSLIIAGGWVSVVIIVILALIGIIAASPFGIFFSNENTDEYISMSEIVMEFNAEYDEVITSIRESNEHDEIELLGNRALWKDILAFYAVLKTTDDEFYYDVAMMTEDKKNDLYEIFWKMNTIDYYIETIEDIEMQQVVDEEDLPVFDEYGDPIEEEVIIEINILYINISGFSAYEMADDYTFDEEKLELLSELLSDENASMWTYVLYGISGTDSQIVTVALSQIGNSGGTRYWSWYGFSYHVEWCACFVSWCANECGYIATGIIPKFAGCEYSGKPWFIANGQWQDNSYTPTAGTIIFFDWNGDGLAQHVGIVEKVENGYVYTIEGNVGDRVKQKSYPLGSSNINGYGIPNYN